MSTIQFVTTLQRKDPRPPVYVVVPGQLVRDWHLAGTTVVEGAANGRPIGRRTLKAWGKGRADWFFELTAAWCSAAGAAVGDEVTVSLQAADVSLAPELETTLGQDPDLASAWTALSRRLQRELSEHVRAARTASGRQRRAEQVAARVGSARLLSQDASSRRA